MDDMYLLVVLMVQCLCSKFLR